jgi:hypothetical protein
VSTDKVYKQRKVYSVTGRAGAARPALDRGLAQWRNGTELGVMRLCVGVVRGAARAPSQRAGLEMRVTSEKEEVELNLVG